MIIGTFIVWKEQATFDNGGQYVKRLTLISILSFLRKFNRVTSHKHIAIIMASEYMCIRVHHEVVINAKLF